MKRTLASTTEPVCLCLPSVAVLFSKDLLHQDLDKAILSQAYDLLNEFPQPPCPTAKNRLTDSTLSKKGCLYENVQDLYSTTRSKCTKYINSSLFSGTSVIANLLSKAIFLCFTISSFYSAQGSEPSFISLFSVLSFRPLSFLSSSRISWATYEIRWFSYSF